ncbi:MAG: transporter substrate-binding domain-containing protein, partial [Kangiellaceae bacterium]|nr:transporter substrate-binding domain-containing protein [Kangiellaceae bacterium]
IVGLGPDLAALIFKELDITVESRYLGPWKRVNHYAQDGQIDLIAGMYKTKHRQVYLAFPKETYANDDVTLFVNSGSEFTYAKWSDLKSKAGCTTSGESFGTDFDEYAKQHLDLIEVVAFSQCLKMLQANRVEYAVNGLFPGIRDIVRFGLEDRIIKFPVPLITQPSYFAISKQSKFVKHIEYLSKRTRELKADGTIDRLLEENIKRWNTYKE